MKLLAFLLFSFAVVSTTCAQTLLLKNGQIVPMDGLVRNGDMVMVSVKSATGGMGQVGYYVSDIAQLNLREPEALKTASDLIAKGQFGQALALIDPLVVYQKTIRDLPGNWWAQAAIVEVSALVGVNRLPDAIALVSEISAYSKDPEILTSAKLQIALTTKFTDPQQALAAYDAVIAESKDPQTLSRAWIEEGAIHVSQHEFADALMAYLTVTVFYSEHNPLTPKALWGSGQAYLKLKDSLNATKTFQQLVATYPDSPEASLAKAVLLKKENNT